MIKIFESKMSEMHSKSSRASRSLTISMFPSRIAKLNGVLWIKDIKHNLKYQIKCDKLYLF